MKINHDLLRELLLCIEENTSYHEAFHFEDSMTASDTDLPSLQALIDKYGTEAICYHLRYCEDGSLLTDIHFHESYTFGIYDCFLTFYGHEFLDTIRDPEGWRRTKHLLCNLGNFSLDAIKLAANAYISSELPVLLPTILKQLLQ